MTESRRKVLVMGVGSTLLSAGGNAGAQTTQGFGRSFASNPSGRALVVSDVVNAPLVKLWWAWTTSSGMKALGWDSSIELRIGGPYEIYFDPSAPIGLKGGEGLRVLSFLPERMLSTEWNAPPKFPETRKLRTWIVVNFDAPTVASTRVTVTHLGWGEGGEWPEVYSYFEQAWPVVLGRCKSRLA